MKKFKFEVKDIPMGRERGWKVLINGEEHRVKKVEITSKYGTLTYGLRPEGYDGLTLHVPGGGGSVTLPYTVSPYGELLVALVHEQRDNLSDKPVWCAIGGFVDPGESHSDAQVRKTAEEAGLDSVTASPFTGPPIVADRLFFVADILAGEGNHLYSLNVPFSMLEFDKAGKEVKSWKIKNSALLKGFRNGDAVRFFDWRDAVRITPDSLALSPIAKLAASVLPS